MSNTYRKKPVEIHAILWTGENVQEMVEFFSKDYSDFAQSPKPMVYIETDLNNDPMQAVLTIPTLEGTMAANMGDWIIRGVNGEFYPCKPDIFEATYEKVEDDE